MTQTASLRLDFPLSACAEASRFRHRLSAPALGQRLLQCAVRHPTDKKEESDMSALPVLAVFMGAGFGALLRWWLGSWLNPVFPTIPLGTVAANLIGGLLIGVASGFFTHNAGLPSEWRLLVITGFMGGLTTFSTFSVEVVTLISRHEYWWAAGAAALHLVGSLALTALGILAANALFVRH